MKKLWHIITEWWVLVVFILEIIGLLFIINTIA